MEEEPQKAYGILALNSTFEEMVGPYLPRMVEAVLLPFNKWNLIEKDKELPTFYHQQMGKIQSRSFGKRLYEIGLTNGWFAILAEREMEGGALGFALNRIYYVALIELNLIM